MKNIIKYTLTCIFSMLAIFYSKDGLNIIFSIPLLAFFMFNGIKTFFISLGSMIISSFISYLLTDLYINTIYFLIAICIYLFCYLISLFINKKLIINFLVSNIISISLTYLIYYLSNDSFTLIKYIHVIILVIVISFLFTYLIKKFSFFLISKLDNTSPIILYSLIMLYSSITSNLSSLYIFNYFTLFICLCILLYYSIKHDINNTLSLNGLIICLAIIFNISFILKYFAVLLLSSVVLSINKSKRPYHNSLLLFAVLLLFYLLSNTYHTYMFLITSAFISVTILFIKCNKIVYEDNKYYLQYVKNKNEMIYQFNNFYNMFTSLSTSFLNAKNNKILKRLSIDVFDNFCKDCSQCYICKNKGKHLLLSYIFDYLNDSIDENKLRYIKQNCLKQNAYFTLLDSFVKTSLIKSYLNDYEIKSKQVISNDFNSFASIINKVSYSLSSDKLLLSSMFYKNIKATLSNYTFDILFINDNSTSSSYCFDIAIKDIKKDEIDILLLPLIEQTLMCKMKVDKIEYATLSSSYYIISISEAEKMQISYAIKQSNEDIKANGDSYFSIIEDNIFYLAISDGMGCGINANEESKFTLDILSSMLKAKIDINDSIKLSNNIIQLKSDSDTYTTLDLLAIDLNKYIISFFKLGAFNAYIIRDNLVTEVNNYSLPLGIIDDIKLSPSSYKIAKNDIIIMCSDGMIDDTNLNIISILEDIKIDEITTMCNLLFSKLISIRQNKDDATLAIIHIQ